LETIIMFTDIPTAGAATEALARQAHQWWAEAAAKAGIDLSGFRPDAPAAERLAWASGLGLDIGAVLSRYSQKMQHSTSSQVQEDVTFAAAHHWYVPPELICVDEAVSGRKSRRAGLDRMRFILKHRLAKILLVYKVSRLFRVAYKGYAFFNEDVVEEGLRGISVSQGIDTADLKTWKSLMYLHGMMDEALLDTIADHVRSGLKNLFAAGFVTGALPVSYRAVEVPGGRPTNRGKPRTMPQNTEATAELIRQHYGWIRDGMAIKEGWRRWVKAGGPCDPRSTLRRMSYHAYRRLLSNPRYIGLWAQAQRVVDQSRLQPADPAAGLRSRLAPLRRAAHPRRRTLLRRAGPPGRAQARPARPQENQGGAPVRPDHRVLLLPALQAPLLLRRCQRQGHALQERGSVPRAVGRPSG
jgi:DNA invertase Pin-like site-specific DNA recombinase